MLVNNHIIYTTHLPHLMPNFLATTMKIMSVGFVLCALLTLTLAASLEEFEVETNNNEEVASKCSNT